MRSLRFAAPLLLGLAALPYASAPAQAQVAMGIAAAPPALPVYMQPPLPAPGYIWVPGYWAWDSVNDDYYWVPGTWVLPPEPGLLWTPGYWAWLDGAYVWYPGYWGENVGFYGGVDYGFGYFGNGYQGGYWNHGHFFYNRSINNFGSAHVPYAYNRMVANSVGGSRVSFNGGAGGLMAHPSAMEMRYAGEHHYAPTPMQMQQEHPAAGNPNLRANVNHGQPPIAATPRPADFSHGAVPAAGGMRPQGQPAPEARPAAPQTYESHPAMAPQPQARPAAPQTYESHPAMAPQPQARPEAPQPTYHPEARPAAPQPQARPEAPRPQAAHPVPEQHQQHQP